MDDKEYWENYYSQRTAEINPSLFAQYVKENVIQNHKSIIELGCGNGRDAIYFAANSFEVVAVDQVSNEIEFLKYRYNQLKNIDFECTDFTNLDNSRKFDLVYSRFTLHSITENQENHVIDWAFENLNANGKFCVEVRGQKNEIFGKGTPVENQANAYIFDDHYRRFLNLETFVNKLITIGFVIEFSAEEKGFAPYKRTDETYIRVIAAKKPHERRF